MEKKKTTVKKEVKLPKTVKDWKHAFSILKQKINLPVLTGLPKADRESLDAYYKITKIVEAENKINNNWKPNYNDPMQGKYSVWNFVKADAKRPSGFGLSYSAYFYSYTRTYVGVRLTVGDSASAIRIGKTHRKLFEKWQLGLK